MSAATCPTSPADRPGGVMTTEIDLDAIRARAKAATPGPWTAYDANEGTGVPACWSVANDEFHNPTSGDAGAVDITITYGGPEDAEFIAHAREDIPALLVEIGRLRADLEFAHGEAKSIYDTCKQIERERDELLAALVELAPAKAAE